MKCAMKRDDTIRDPWSEEKSKMRTRTIPSLSLAVVALAAIASPFTASAADLDAVNRIRAEALERSQVMETARVLTDELGPRLSGSPAMKRANEWTRDRLAEWGLERARIEPFEFGSGWSYSRAEVRMLAPSVVPLPALPKAWTPGTSGTVRGAVARVDLATEADLEAQKGKLAGKIVLLDSGRPDAEAENRPGPIRTDDFERFDDDKLGDLVDFDVREPRRETFRERARKRHAFGPKLAEYLVAEGVLATVELSSRDFGILRGGGESANRDRSRPRGVAGVYLGREAYQRILRLLEQKREVELELTVEASFHDDGTGAFNTLAEIPGRDRRSEIVLVGAHLDSWHGGTGATDNAAGAAVVMEAARILRAIGAQPRRTIRVILWSGEEQGLVGSRAYVREHVADRPDPTDPEELALPHGLRRETWPIRPRGEHGRISAYFNLDNGGGRIRGIYTQGNVAVAPLFRDWLTPLADLGATTVTNESTRSTDHVPFDAVGVPAFQFIQDPLDYFPRTHHTNLDTYERLRREDLVQASIVLATFLLETANRDQLLPRKPLPTAPPERSVPEGSKPAEPAQPVEPTEPAGAAR